MLYVYIFILDLPTATGREPDAGTYKLQLEPAQLRARAAAVHAGATMPSAS